MKLNHSGFSLMELVVYTALIIIFSSMVGSFFVRIIHINLYSQAAEEVITSSQRAMNIIIQEIQRASSVYTPASVFDSHPGQLSLETVRQLPTGETNTFVDFYIDDERLYIKREGESAKLIISPHVKVSNFVITHLSAADQYPAIRVAFIMIYANSSATIEKQSQVTLTSTSTFRTY